MEKNVCLESEDRYLTGIDWLDDQHKELLRMINTILQGCGTDDEGGRNFFKQSVLRLMQYLQFHFDEEEKFLEKIAYPDRTAHAKQHRECIQEILEVLKNIENNGFPSPAAFLEYIRERLFTHMTLIDKKYASFLHLVNFQAGDQPRFWTTRTESQGLPTEAFIG